MKQVRLKTLLELALPVALLTAAAVSIRFFCKDFGYSRNVIFVHLAIVASCLAAVSGLCCSARGRWQHAAAFALSTVAVLLTAIDAACYFSNRAWGDNITFGLVWNFLLHDGQAWEKISEFGQSPGRVALGLAVLCLMLGVIYYWSLRYVGALGRWRREGPRAFAACVASCAFAPALLTAVDANYRPEDFRGEPILGSVFSWPPTVDIAGNDRFRKEADIGDDLARQSYPWKPVPHPRNVVILMFDSLRADHLPMYGYARQTTPFLSSLAAKGELSSVRMALSTCSESFCGIASTLSSHNYHHVASHNFRLHEILQREGYRNTFLLTGEHHVWAGLKYVYGNEVDRWYDFHTEGTPMHDDQSIMNGLEKLPVSDGRPAFIFSFAMATHILGARLPEFRQFLPDDPGDYRKLWSSRSLSKGYRDLTGKEFDPRGLEGVINNYDNGVLQGDALAKKMFEVLKAKGYLDDALVIIVGDHGDSMGEHDHLGHNTYLYQEETRIPLLLWSSSGLSFKNTEFASHVDIAPTVLDALGLPIPESFEGSSLLSANIPEYNIHQTRRGRHPCASAVLRDTAYWKLLSCIQDDGSLRDTVYNLTDDPAESRDVSGGVPASIERRLMRALSYFRGGQVINTCTTDDCREP